MPTDGCSECMPIVIINFKLRGVEQNSVPYMMKVIQLYLPTFLLSVGVEAMGKKFDGKIVS